MGSLKRLLVIIGLLSSFSIAGAALAMPSTTSAAAYNPFGDACTESGNKSSACTTNGQNTLVGSHGVIRKASYIISSIAGVAAVIVMIIGGLQYVVSSGDATKTANARTAIIGAAVGLGIIVGAQAIVVFVLSKIH